LLFRFFFYIRLVHVYIDMGLYGFDEKLGQLVRCE